MEDLPLAIHPEGREHLAIRTCAEIPFPKRATVIRPFSLAESPLSVLSDPRDHLLWAAVLRLQAQPFTSSYLTPGSALHHPFYPHKNTTREKVMLSEVRWCQWCRELEKLHFHLVSFVSMKENEIKTGRDQKPREMRRYLENTKLPEMSASLWPPKFLPKSTEEEIRELH